MSEMRKIAASGLAVGSHFFSAGFYSVREVVFFDFHLDACGVTGITVTNVDVYAYGCTRVSLNFASALHAAATLGVHAPLCFDIFIWWFVKSFLWEVLTFAVRLKS